VVCDVCGSETDVAPVTFAIDGAEQVAETVCRARRHLQNAVAGVLRTLTAAEHAAAEQLAPAPRGRKTAASTVPPARRATRTYTTTAPTAHTERRMRTTTCPHCGLELGVQNLGRAHRRQHPEAAGPSSPRNPLPPPPPVCLGANAE